MLVSHSRFPERRVHAHIWLTQGTLRYYTGNYDTYQKTVRDDEVVQQKSEKEQADIKHLKEFIASCGTYANARKQAESKQKIIDKMIAAGLTLPVVKERNFTSDLRLHQGASARASFDNVSFAYDGKKEHYLYETWTLASTATASRCGPTARVSPRQARDSELTPTKGNVTRYPSLLIGKYHQHSVDVSTSPRRCSTSSCSPTPTR